MMMSCIPSASRGGPEPPDIFPFASDGGKVWRWESEKRSILLSSKENKMMLMTNSRDINCHEIISTKAEWALNSELDKLN